MKSILAISPWLAPLAMIIFVFPPPKPAPMQPLPKKPTIAELSAQIAHVRLELDDEQRQLYCSDLENESMRFQIEDKRRMIAKLER